MSFKWFLITTGDACDKCAKPMSLDDPGIHLSEQTKGEQRHAILVHIECVQQALFAARKMHLQGVIADFKQASKSLRDAIADEVKEAT